MKVCLPCCAPHCRRTFRTEDPEEEWLCSRHYPLASRESRVEYEEAWKRADAEDKRVAAGGYEANLTVYVRVTNAWARLKTEAIEAAGGIG